MKSMHNFLSQKIYIFSLSLMKNKYYFLKSHKHLIISNLHRIKTTNINIPEQFKKNFATELFTYEPYVKTHISDSAPP